MTSEQSLASAFVILFLPGLVRPRKVIDYRKPVGVHDSPRQVCIIGLSCIGNAVIRLKRRFYERGESGLEV